MDGGRGWRGRAAGVVATLALVGACAAGSDDPSPDRGAAEVAPELLTTYGYGALTDPEATYQPDVVVVEGGPAGIRSASADGLRWVIDGDAPGAADLELGSVMFMTASAVGRVVELDDQDGDRLVALAPVGLEEVVQDGSIALEQDLDLTTLRYQHVPELPGALSEPAAVDPFAPEVGLAEASPAGVDEAEEAAAGTVVLPPIELVAHAAPVVTLGDLPASQKSSGEFELGDWTVKPTVAASKLGLAVQRKAGAGLKVGVNVDLLVNGLRVEASASVRDGVLGSPTFVLHGIEGLHVSLSAGAKNGDIDNSTVRMEVPVKLSFPIPPSPATGGLPMNVSVTFKFLVTTALSGKDSTLLAAGQYGLAGPIGMRGGKILAPTFSMQQSILDSISGIAIGPSGIVVATSTKVQVGIGTPAVMAGPYGSLTASIGLTNGSALGSPLATCRSATLDLTVGGGASLTLSEVAADALNALLPTGNKVEFDVGTSKNVLHRSQTQPAVPLCQG